MEVTEDWAGFSLKSLNFRQTDVLLFLKQWRYRTISDQLMKSLHPMVTFAHRSKTKSFWTLPIVAAHRLSRMTGRGRSLRWRHRLTGHLSSSSNIKHIFCPKPRVFQIIFQVSSCNIRLKDGRQSNRIKVTRPTNWRTGANYRMLKGKEGIIILFLATITYSNVLYGRTESTKIIISFCYFRNID